MSLIIPIFIPHYGCQHHCVFCNQTRISGQNKDVQIDAKAVEGIISKWLGYSRKDHQRKVQTAFYGGSFTGLELARQIELLKAVRPFIDSGKVHSIRVSTRPDYINTQIIDFLSDNKVSMVELGVQSLDDDVLVASGRGHKSDQVFEAVRLLREAGMGFGMQLMVGLPGESNKSLLRTAAQTVELCPDCVRIYPVLVIKETRLAQMYEKGIYRPLSLDQAIAKTARLKKYFDSHCIPVIRMGLQAGTELERSLLAGPYHPAFGELVKARLMFKQTRTLLSSVVGGQKVKLFINGCDQSVFRGMKSANMKSLDRLGLLKNFTLFVDPKQPRLTVRMSTQD